MKTHFIWYTLIGQRIVLCGQIGAKKFTLISSTVTCKKCKYQKVLAEQY